MWQLASRPGSRIEIFEAGLACCALEVEAAVSRGWLIPGAPESPAGAEPVVLVVAGTVTTALEPAIQRWVSESSHGRVGWVVSFGACSTSGGPYWDAPTVRNGVDALVPVSAYIPGCPPRPEALIAELERIVDDLEHGDGEGAT